MSPLARRAAWHVRLAWRSSSVAVAVAGLGGALLPQLLPVTEAWLVAAVAVLAALLAFALVAAGSRGPVPDVADVDAALEGAATKDLVAHALARAALLLGALALGLAIGSLLPGAQEA